MAVVFSDLKTRLNTWLRDAQNLTFTDAEKTEILTEAINDPFVASIVRDTSITIVAGTYTYNVPTGIDAFFELGYDKNGDGLFHVIPREYYDVINGVIYLSIKSLPAGRSLIVVGKNKLTTASTDYPARVQEYILHLAMVGAFEMLKTSLTTRFVKNDMTMADIINSINTHKQRAEELRRTITNQRLVTL